MGAHEPLMKTQVDASWFHGSDGFGGSPHTAPKPLEPSVLPRQSTSAVQALLSAAAAHHGTLRVVALGPLTNLALAYKLHRGLAHELAGLYVMGGAWGAGNVTRCAEFNFHVDPEAAHIVMDRFARVTLVTWTLTAQQPVPWERMDAYLRGGGPAAELMRAIMQRDLEKWKAGEELNGGWIACDPVALAIAVDDSLVLEAEARACHVEWQGSNVAKGMTVFDDRPADGETQCNVRLVKRFDLERFSDMMIASMSA